MAAVTMTLDEAQDFLDEVLEIENVDAKLQTDKLTLLNEIARGFHRRVPFQNLSLLLLDPEQRQLPSATGIYQAVSSGIGGLCNVLNTFCQSLLTALGYQAFTVGCYIVDAGNICTHIATIVEGVEVPGDLYFVDVGASFPTFQGIPLHDLPQSFHDGFLHYKYEREGKSVFRYHQRVNSETTEWQKFYEFQIIPQDADFTQKCLEPVYVVPGYGSKWYLLEVRLSIYPDNKAVTINDRVLKVWDGSTGKLETKMMLDDIDVECAIRQYFPMLKEVDVRKALKMRREQKELWLQSQTLRVKH